MQANLRTVQARRALIARELSALQAEDADLQTVETILHRLSGKATRVTSASAAKRPGRPPGKASKASKASPGRKANGALSQRELIVDALKRASDPWLKVADIIAEAKRAHGVTMPARSISPLLSNMKKDKAIVRRGRLVALPARAKSKPKT